jgi:hypothetical protein
MYYGKFNVSWTGDGTTYNYRKLQPWLNPTGTAPTTLNGIACSKLDHYDFAIAATSEGSNMFSLEASANVTGVDKYEWELMSGSGWTITQHPFPASGQPSMYKVRVTKNSGGSSQAVVRGRPHNGCGWSDEWIPIMLPLTSSYSMSASLSSGSTTLSINIDIEDSEAYETAFSQSQSGTSGGTTSAPVFTIKLYNNLGTIVRQTTASSGTVSLDVANLPNGFYILHVHDGSANPPQTQNIIISH